MARNNKGQKIMKWKVKEYRINQRITSLKRLKTLSQSTKINRDDTN